MKEPLIQFGRQSSHKGGRVFGINPEDARHHCYIVGKTGSGKTTLLRNLILQHIRHGHGVGIIDPHGDLAEEILQYVPSHRADDLVYFNPGDLDFPVGLNLLYDVAHDDRPLVVSGVVSALKSLWPDSWGPRMEYILQNSIAALLCCENTSLLGVNRMLTDEKYRAWVVRQIDDPFIRDFWELEFAGYDARFRREAIAPIQNKLGQFLLHPVARNILGQVKTKIRFAQIIDNGQIFVANLAKGRLGADKAHLLGSLLVTQFQLAALARSSQREDERQDFHLLIDEFQNFATESFVSTLAEARKYRLSLTLANQYCDQLALSIRKAVFGNVGTTVSFRVGFQDALVLQDEFAREFLAEQFVQLDRFEVFARLQQNGHSSSPIRGETLPPLHGVKGVPERLIARSRERFAMPRADVEGKLNHWLRCDPRQTDSQALRNRIQPPSDRTGGAKAIRQLLSSYLNHQGSPRHPGRDHQQNPLHTSHEEKSLNHRRSSKRKAS